VLVERLVGRLPPDRELLGRQAVLRDAGGVVVVDLVVVPRDREREPAWARCRSRSVL
jgi:hypothetical protein